MIPTRNDLVRLLDRLDARVGVELGVAKGNFSHHLVTRHRFERFYLIDKWNDHHDSAEKQFVEARFAKQPNVVILHDTFANCVGRFPDGYFDFIYIDGYAHTGQDKGRTLSAWYSKLKPGASTRATITARSGRRRFKAWTRSPKAKARRFMSLAGTSTRRGTS